MTESNIDRTKKTVPKTCTLCGKNPCLTGWKMCEPCWEKKFKWPKRPAPKP